MFLIMQALPDPGIAGVAKNNLFVQYGIAGAVLVALWMFLRFLSKEREDRKGERESLVAEIGKSREEYISSITKLTSDFREDVKGTLSEVREVVQACRRNT